MRTLAERRCGRASIPIIDRLLTNAGVAGVVRSPTRAPTPARAARRMLATRTDGPSAVASPRALPPAPPPTSHIHPHRLLRLFGAAVNVRGAGCGAVVLRPRREHGPQHSATRAPVAPVWPNWLTATTTALPCPPRPDARASPPARRAAAVAPQDAHGLALPPGGADELDIPIDGDRAVPRPMVH